MFFCERWKLYHESLPPISVPIYYLNELLVKTIIHMALLYSSKYWISFNVFLSDCIPLTLLVIKLSLLFGGNDITRHQILIVTSFIPAASFIQKISLSYSSVTPSSSPFLHHLFLHSFPKLLLELLQSISLWELPPQPK